MNMVLTEDQVVNIAQQIRRCPTITLARAFTRAYRDWAGQTQYLRISIPGATQANIRQYALGDDPYLEITAVLAMQGSQTTGGHLQLWPIGTSDSSQWDPNMPTGMPVRYCYVPQAQVALDPVPKQVYDLLITAIVQPKEGAEQVPVDGLTRYRSNIEAGALGYLYNVKGQPWSDPNQAMLNMRVFQTGVNNARADVQRAFNTGSVRVRPRPLFR
jgi:hypothetical protein